MMKRRMIYLIRHAEHIKYGIQKTYFGQANPPLSPYGIQQAESLSYALRGRQIEAVFSSDLRRAKQTATIIAARHCGKPKTYIDLREIRLGNWEDDTFTEIQQKYPHEYMRHGDDFVNYRPPGGESFGDLAHRVIPVFTRIIKETQGNIVIVAHAGVNRVILCHLQQIELKKLFSLKQEYAHVSIIQQIDSVFRVGEVNMTDVRKQQEGVLH